MAGAADLIGHLDLVIQLKDSSLANAGYEDMLSAVRAVASGPLGNLAPADFERRRQEIKDAIATDRSQIASRAGAAIKQLESISGDLRSQLDAQIRRRLQELRENPDSWGAD
jgi:uncharacterized protein (UPF0147 family)